MLVYFLQIYHLHGNRVFHSLFVVNLWILNFQEMITQFKLWCYSIAEFAVDNSIIKPTYMLTYESASELIHLSLEEEIELKILSEAATLRLQWRRQQVGLIYLIILTTSFQG